MPVMPPGGDPGPAALRTATECATTAHLRCGQPRLFHCCDCLHSFGLERALPTALAICLSLANAGPSSIQGASGPPCTPERSQCIL